MRAPAERGGCGWGGSGAWFLGGYASADFNAKESGLVDVIYDTEKELFLGLRGLIELLPANNRENAYSSNE